MKKLILVSFTACALVSCNKDLENEVAQDTSFQERNSNQSQVVLENHSVTPNFLDLKPGFKNLDVTVLLSSEDQLEESPNFVYGSMADGCGLLKEEAGTYTLIYNI